jgi:hypothetical protein
LKLKPQNEITDDLNPWREIGANLLLRPWNRLRSFTAAAYKTFQKTFGSSALASSGKLKSFKLGQFVVSLSLAFLG